MIHSVYHDYALCFGAWVSSKDLKADAGQSYIAKLGQVFVWGVKTAWIEPHLLATSENHQIALESLSKRCRAYAAARKFLVYGEMLREPKLINPVPEINVKWYIGWTEKYYDISMPAVLCSFWRAPDGNLGLVLYNISPEDQQISLILDDPGYGTDSAARSKIICLYPVGGETSAWKFLDKPNMTLSCTVQARSPMVFEIELKD
jgi:hypothetical protein